MTTLVDASPGVVRSVVDRVLKESPSMAAVVVAAVLLYNGLSTDIASLKADFVTLRAEVSALKADFVPLRAEMTTLKSEDVARLRADVEALKARVGQGVTSSELTNRFLTFCLQSQVRNRGWICPISPGMPKVTSVRTVPVKPSKQ